MVSLAEVDLVDPADVVVVGSGVAGLSTALHVDGAKVTLLTAEQVGAGSASAVAQGGLAAAVGVADSPDVHAADTLAVGWGANDADVVALLTTAAPGTVRWLDGLGTRFERAGSRWALCREAGHSRDRILHAGGDATGREITRALTAAALAAPHVTVHTGTVAVALLVDGGHVIGVLARRGGRLLAVPSGAVVLATGGAAGAWRHTTNPAWSRGSGLVLAADAGAELADLQYVQFHPTALDCEADPLPLLTEALRGAGGTLLDGTGRRFLADVHPAAELAPRDVVARAIWERRAAGDRVLLDLRHLDDLARRFPTAVASCRRHGVDPAAEPVPVKPAAHYHMGGVAVDREGRSSVPGLWAAGEVACTGAHGANRLASNSLLEALVFGERIGRSVGRRIAPTSTTIHRALAAIGSSRLAPADPAVVASVRDLLTRDVGVLRTGAGLRGALAVLAAPTALDAGGDLAVLARMIAAAALAHRERRGAHWRADGAEPLASAPRVVVTAAERGRPLVTVNVRDPVLAGAP